MSAKGKFFDIRDTRPEKARPWLQQETGHDRDAGEAITSIFDAVEIGTEADVMRVLGACTAAQRESRNELGQVPIEAACWHGRAPALRLLATRGGASLYSQWTADSAPLQVIPTPSHLLGRISPISFRFPPVFCAFSPPRRGGSNEPQAGTQGQETATGGVRTPFCRSG